MSPAKKRSTARSAVSRLAKPVRLATRPRSGLGRRWLRRGDRSSTVGAIGDDQFTTGAVGAPRGQDTMREAVLESGSTLPTARLGVTAVDRMDDQPLSRRVERREDGFAKEGDVD